jgi:predicted outer membrane repeat protein
VGVFVTAGNADGVANPICFGGPDHGQPCSGEDCLLGTCVSVDTLGAGIFILGGQPTIADCRIVDNFAAFQGAGIILKGQSDAVIAACTFSGNRALDNGGAMYLGHSSPTVTQCTFDGNSGGRYAGAVCNRDLSNAIFDNCVFIDNTAADEELTGGGAVVNASSSPTFTGCVFAGNRSIAGNGGALYNKMGFNPELGFSSPVLVNCIFQANEAGDRGGAVYNIEGSTPTFLNCTFLENDAVYGFAMYNTQASVVSLTDCVVGGVPSGPPGGGVAIGIYNEGTGATVQAVGCTFTSYAYGVYNIDGVADIEACTFLDAGVLNGGGLLTAVLTMTDCTTTGENPALRLDKGTATLTGCTMTGITASYAIYTGGQPQQQDDPPVLTLTDCNLSNNATTSSSQSLLRIVDAAEATLINCVLKDNTGPGRVVRVQDAVLTMINCTINDNTTGGAIRAAGSDVVLTDCRLINNAAIGGGAMSLVGGTASISRCSFVSNSAQNSGGAVYTSSADPVFTSCIFVLNDAALDRGGAMFCNDGAPSVINCTFYGNTSYWPAGGISIDDSDLVLTNSILWGNSDGGTITQSDQFFIEGYHADPVVNYSCIQGWTGSLGGVGNMGSNPQFVDAVPPDDAGESQVVNVRLLGGSACIDAGDNTAATTGDIDLVGSPRFIDDSCAPDDGAPDGVNPMVDLGAYEFLGTSPSTVPADVNGDCVVSIPDLLLLLQAWGPCPDPPAECPADVDGSGTVDIIDFQVLLNLWT